MYDVLQDSEMSGIFESVLDVSSANAYKIQVDFSYRFRVWKNEILPDRLLSIKMEHSVEYVHRMTDLLIDDVDRLMNRASREYAHGQRLFCIATDINDVMEETISDYFTEITRIKSEGDKQCTE